MPPDLDELGLLRLLQLTSPSLPIGAFAWSQGLEAAVQAGWIGNEAQATDWLTAVLDHALARSDVPVLLRLHEAITTQHIDVAAQWNRWLLACRETRELLQEDTHIGAALLRLLLDLDAPVAQSWQAAQGRRPLSYAAAFALATVHADLPARMTALGYLWAWSENQAAALIKLGVLGQTGAQRLLNRLHPAIRAALDLGLSLEDDELGMALPGLALASAHHEIQHSRLFRS
ncbi:MAG: urease accessory UreF family protein [Candidatus Macondimonas sp.]